ncbi:MAG: aromatic amino acid transport family protein [Parachlamydiaceae bacterium]|nr:aromatic amino acid transport family protein [Parachlamydiaceae bacterium]
MSNELTKKGSTLSAIFLITGCCIGAGMIGFPVMTATAGFIPSTIAMILCYLFAAGSGLLLLEATMWFDYKVNLISLSNFTLGKTGKAITWFFFLFLFYCLFVAYIDGGGQIFANSLSSLFHLNVAREIGIILCVAVIGAITYLGTRTVSLVSRIFLVGLIASFIFLIAFGIPSMQGDRLLHANWPAMISTIPILLICFGYQNLIPTLIDYLKKDLRTIRIAIFVGNLIPFCIYLIWNTVILGILPEENTINAASQSDMVTGLLQKAAESESVIFFAQTFSFFAILTPFMTNTIAFVDFLKDGLNLSKYKVNHASILYGLVLVPPMLLTLFYPHLFLRALGLAGGFADVILFGIMPVLIVWIGRYKKNMIGPYQAPGGKLFLLLIFLFSLGFLFIRN